MQSNMFRKKPVVVEATQFWNDASWPKGVCDCHADTGHLGTPHIHTLEGCHDVSEGDWIITGVKGELYPCKPDIFEMTYEPAGTSGPQPPVDWEGAVNLKDSAITPVEERKNVEQRAAAAIFMRDVMGFKAPQQIEVWTLKGGSVMLRVLPVMKELETIGPPVGTVTHRGDPRRVR